MGVRIDHRLLMHLASTMMAVGAALLYAISVTLQQPAARGAQTRRGGHLGRRHWLPVVRLLGPLVRDRGWVIGWILNVAGFLLHAVALHYGSITIVQAVLVVQLMFALGLAATVRRQRLSIRDWLGALTVCAGVVILIVSRGDVPQSVPQLSRVAEFAVVAAAGVVVLLALARLTRHQSQIGTALVAIGAGVCFVISAVFVIVLTDILARGGPAAAAWHWSLPCLIVTAIAGSILVQDSFASGSLPTALTATTITDPVISSIAGFVLFDAYGPVTLAALTSVAGAGILIAAGVTIIATSATLHLDSADVHPRPQGAPAASRSTIHHRGT